MFPPILNEKKNCAQRKHYLLNIIFCPKPTVIPDSDSATFVETDRSLCRLPPVVPCRLDDREEGVSNKKSRREGIFAEIRPSIEGGVLTDSFLSSSAGAPVSNELRGEGAAGAGEGVEDSNMLPKVDFSEDAIEEDADAASFALSFS